MTKRKSNIESANVLACPECRTGVTGISDEGCLCPGCGRRFRRLRGIWEMLPLGGDGMPEDARQ